MLASPELGERLAMLGKTVNGAPLLAKPFTVTMIDPLVPPAGTGTTIDVPLQLVGAADVPLNVIVLVPCVDPKFAPVTVTDDPMAAAAVDKLEIPGP